MLQRLKSTLTGGGLALLLSTVLLFGLIRSSADSDGQYGAHGGTSIRVYQRWNHNENRMQPL